MASNRKVLSNNLRYTFDENKQLLIHEIVDQQKTKTFQVNTEGKVSSEEKEVNNLNFSIMQELAESKTTILVNAINFHVKTEEQEEDQLHIVRKLLQMPQINLDSDTIQNAPLLHVVLARQAYRKPKLLMLLLEQDKINIHKNNTSAGMSTWECACYHGVEAVINLLKAKLSDILTLNRKIIKELTKDGFHEAASLLTKIVLSNSSSAPFPAEQNKLFLAPPEISIDSKFLKEISEQHPHTYIMIVQGGRDTGFPMLYRYDGKSKLEEPAQELTISSPHIIKTIYPKRGMPMVEVREEYIPVKELTILKTGEQRNSKRYMQEIAETSNAPKNPKTQDNSLKSS